ncbi:hypothetical protein [Aggregatilinea lenta]|uniref:hypothetical protein n=1 Tax=Aggregatilinea lenta TaxID=913108 RepID=UPI0013C338BD|nr:hypothetical protein [Aggregatilinea lenta]
MRRSAPITPREWRRVALFAALVMVFTTIPYLVAWGTAGHDTRFGGFLFGVEDGYSYLAKMRLGARGDWLFTLRHTTESHDGALMFLPHLLLGKLAAPFVPVDDPVLPDALAILYHAARVASGWLLILICYRFTAEFLPSRRARWLALILITFGGGLGWLLLLVGAKDWLSWLPLDFYLPEGYSALILYGLPHLALARSALLGGFLLLFRALDAPTAPWRRSASAGLCWAVMGLAVPFYVPVVYAVLGAWGLAAWLREGRFPWRLFRQAVIAALVPLPMLIYTGIVFLTNDVFGQWSAQNQLPSPHPLHYVFGYIVLALPALAAFGWAWRRGGRGDIRTLLLVGWLTAVPVLVYLPINVQRRLAEAVIVPLSILAVAGLRLVVQSRRARRWATVAVLCLALPTSAILWLGEIGAALGQNPPLFWPDPMIDALARLDTAAPQDARVLTTREMGSYVPVQTDLVSYVGHGPETLDGERKNDEVERFFAGKMDTDERRALLDGIDYVFYGPFDPGASDPTWAEELHPIAAADDANLYRSYEVPHDAP